MTAFRTIIDPNTGNIIVGDGTGHTQVIGSKSGGVFTTRFTFADTGFLTVAAGITISAFSVAGIVKNSALGALSSGQVVAAEIANSAVGPTKLDGAGLSSGQSWVWNGSAFVAQTVGTGSGTIASVVAGAGLTGGGSSGSVTIDVGANADGSIVVNANEIQVGVLATDAQHGTRGGGTLHALVGTVAAGFVPAIGGTSNRVLVSTDHLNATWGQVSDPMISGVGWAKVSGTPTTLVGYGIIDAVPSGRTLTGTAPVRIQGDSAPHSLATNLTFSVDGATVVNPGVITLTTDLAGLFNAPTVVQLTGASGIVSVLASTIRFADGISPAFSQVQAATGSGATSSWRAQKGANGSAGGALELGGGQGGTPGTDFAGPTVIDLGTSVANVSAHFEAVSGSFTVLDVSRTALNTVTIDTSALATFKVAKAIGVYIDAATGGGPNVGEYSLAVGNTAGKDKVFFAVGGGQPITDATPRYYVTVAPGTVDVVSSTPVASLATVHVGQQTFNSITGATRSVSGPLASVLIDGAPVLSGAFWAGGQTTYALYVASGIARFAGGVEFGANSFLVGNVGSAPLFIDSLGQVFLGDGTHTVSIDTLNLTAATVTTSATSGAAFSLPSNPQGYVSIGIAGVTRKIPFYI